MTKATFGNHTAVRVRRTERDKIRHFYRDVLGCTIIRELDDKDDIRMGDDFYLAFLYEGGDGREVDQGVVYGAEDPLSPDDSLKAIFLELKTNDVGEMRQRIVASGVRLLEVPDPHLYFQAPGGQVWRLVGVDEDLSRYEGTEPGQQGAGRAPEAHPPRNELTAQPPHGQPDSAHCASSRRSGPTDRRASRSPAAGGRSPTRAAIAGEHPCEPTDHGRPPVAWSADKQFGRSAAHS